MFMCRFVISGPPKPKLEVDKAIAHFGEDVDFNCISQCNNTVPNLVPTYKYFNGNIHLSLFGTDANYIKHSVTTADTSSTYNCKVKVDGVESDPSDDVSLTVGKTWQLC